MTTEDAGQAAETAMQAMERSMAQLEAVSEGYKFLGDNAGKLDEVLGFRKPANRKERRSIGQTSKKPVKLYDEVDWPDGRVTVESFPSKRAPKRTSGARKKVR